MVFDAQSTLVKWFFPRENSNQKQKKKLVTNSLTFPIKYKYQKCKNTLKNTNVMENLLSNSLYFQNGFNVIYMQLVTMTNHEFIMNQTILRGVLLNYKTTLGSMHGDYIEPKNPQYPLVIFFEVEKFGILKLPNIL